MKKLIVILMMALISVPMMAGNPNVLSLKFGQPLTETKTFNATYFDVEGTYTLHENAGKLYRVDAETSDAKVTWMSDDMVKEMVEHTWNIKLKKEVVSDTTYLTYEDTRYKITFTLYEGSIRLTVIDEKYR
jgi:hypothetical protein